MSVTDVGHPVMPAFVELLQSPVLNMKFNTVQFHFQKFLLSIQKSTKPAARTIIKKMEEKVARQTSVVDQSMFIGHENAAMAELGTDFLRQILRAASAVNSYVLSDGRIREYFHLLFKDRKYGPTLFDGGILAECSG